MQLQRSAGNAAVARALAPCRTTQVPTIGPTDDATTGMFVKEVTAETPPGAARVLGLTTPPRRGALRLPEVSAMASEGGVTLTVSDVADTDDFSSQSVAAGEVLRKSGVTVQVLPEYAAVLDDPAFPPGAVTLTQNSGVARGGMETVADMTVVYCVSEDEAGLIRQNEQQHPDDFAQAFRVSAGVVEHAVAELSDRVFDTEEAAVRALGDRLDPRLVPEWPLAPEAWEQHIWQVLWELYDVSKERDRRGEHEPEGRSGTVDLKQKWLTMSPRMAAPWGASSADWVTLDRANITAATPQFQALQLPWVAGTGVVLQSDHACGLWDQTLSAEGADTVLPRGTYGTFEGSVMRRAKWLLRINLDDGKSLLLKPTDAALFAPGQRPAVVEQPAAESTFVAKLESGGVTRIRPDVEQVVRFFHENSLEPRPDSEMESGPGRAFAQRNLTVIKEAVDEDGKPGWFVSTAGDYETIYAIIRTEFLLGSG